MTCTPNPALNAGSANTADQRPITIAAWLAADLLRVLNELRFGQRGRLPGALRDDLDYHAGLLRLRIHRATDPRQ